MARHKHRKPKSQTYISGTPGTQTYHPDQPAITSGGGLTSGSGASISPPKKPPAPVQPLDPNVVNQQTIANRDIGLNDVYSTWQQGNLDQQYGFGAGGAANPYSDAAKYQENYKRSVSGTTGSYGNQGQFNSGAYGRAQNENARNFDMSYDAARRAYDQASGNLQFGRVQTYANAGTGVDDATFNALLKALGGL